MNLIFNYFLKINKSNHLKIINVLLRIAEQFILFSIFYVCFYQLNLIIILPYGFILILLFILMLLESFILIPIFNTKFFLKNLLISYTFFFNFLIFKALQELFLSSGYLTIITYIFSWIELSNSLIIDFQLNQNLFTLIGVFLVVLTSICILMFSIEYLNIFEILKFIQFMIFFVIFMLINILANDLILTFIGWEGIGLMSFILINFWKTRHEANKSALKAFLINKIGDFAFFFIIIYFSISFYTTNFQVIPMFTLTVSNFKITIISLIFLIIVLSKSAQFFLHFWLDDAMEGPTSVSALIHAATLVTAGSFLFIKIPILFSQFSFMNLVLLIGIFSSIIGILSSLEQDDLKKTIAYTTLTNIGLVFIFFGLGFFHLGFFHLITHGFYKAFTFLSVGNFIHLTNGEQSAQFKGLTAKIFSLDYFFLVLSSFSMIGFPFLGAFYSKEIIFSFSNYTTNLFFISLISIIWSLGIISNFSILSLFFKNLPPRNINILFSLFHKNKIFIDSLLFLLSIFVIFFPIIIYNFFYNLEPIFILYNTSLNTGLIQENILTNSFLFIKQSEIYLNIIQLSSLLIVPFLLNSKITYKLLNNSIGDYLILGTVTIFGKFSKQLIKFFYLIFFLNEYILIEFIYFFFIKQFSFSKIKFKIINLNYYFIIFFILFYFILLILLFK
jgi:NADH:ubiquinone oxidoreductase subunit 5 (subunit L)/multisubunit Na+/H+ antiporter MnhA subunit